MSQQNGPANQHHDGERSGMSRLFVEWSNKFQRRETSQTMNTGSLAVVDINLRTEKFWSYDREYQPGTLLPSTLRKVRQKRPNFSMVSPKWQPGPQWQATTTKSQTYTRYSIVHPHGTCCTSKAASQPCKIGRLGLIAKIIGTAFQTVMPKFRKSLLLLGRMLRI